MKKIIFVLTAMTLVGCNSVQGPSVTKYKVVEPANSLYSCPLYKNFPDPNKLTDPQVAQMLVQLYGNNVKCYNAVQSLRKFLEQSKNIVEQSPENTSPLPYWQ